ncbi:hypothetical protein I4F81_004083 [Pyropia yezoensis]|uniref:Uncharacterized protein n=1 Tax=Pyropia yezoensis TaxID=2788 RepID=A0ACC3BTY4_PYRYE|nr:hypothetical protein I4F81_004083 [Neopyropia yezoensis]
MTAATRRGMDSMQVSKNASGMDVHSSQNARKRSSLFLGAVSRACRRRSSSFEGFSMGLRSGLCPTQGSTLNTSAALAALLRLDAWQGAKSSCSQAPSGDPKSAIRWW